MKPVRRLSPAAGALTVALGLAATPALAQTAPPPAQTAPQPPAQTAQPAPSPALNLRPEQVERIRKYFATIGPTDRPVDAGVEVTVGGPIPDGIETEPLPGAILVDLPAGVDFQYFRRGDDLVIVDAETRTAVAIVPKQT